MDILAAMPVQIYWKDNHGVYLGCNDQQAKMVGLTKGTDIIGKTDNDLPWRQPADVLKEQDRHVMEAGQACCVEETRQLMDGSIITVLSHKVPLRNQQNDIIGILGISFDITQRKQAAEELKKAKERAETAEKSAQQSRIYLNNILEYSPSNIFWKSLDGRYLGCNEAAAQMIYEVIGYPCQIIGKNDYDFFDEEIADIFVKHDEKVIRTGNPITYEENITLATGKKIIYLCNKTALRDENGNIIGVLSSSFDITKQKQKENALLHAQQVIEREKKHTELYLSTIVANLPDHVFWENTESVFLGCNHQQAKSFGLEKAEDLIGKRMEDMGRSLGWDEKTLDRILKNDAEVMRTGSTVSIEENVVWADGISRTFLSKKAPLKDEHGECMGMLGMAFDITEQKNTEKKLLEAKLQAEASNRAKSDFIANISHDLRTPLHTVLGTSELLKLQNHFTDQEKHFDAIIQSSETLLKLVENILDFSKIEQGEVNIEHNPCNVKKLITDILVGLTNSINEKNIKVILHYEDNTSYDIISDAEAIGRIITNLLSNAIKFTEHGQIFIDVEWITCDAFSGTLQLTVRDTGIGIPQEEIKHIFDRFYRVNPSYQGKYKGTGLGLTITKKLIEYLNGSIAVKSQLNVGTEFICTFPFQFDRHNALPAHQQYGMIPQQCIPTKKMSILFVEDVPLIQRFSANMLETLGCDVTLASNGKEALQYSKNTYDLIFMDIGLPDEDGLAVIRKI